jgi:hypothetical protein
MKKSLFIFFMLILGLPSFAQGGRSQVDRDKIQAARIAFLTNRLDLSVDQAKVFWPIFNEYDGKKNTLSRDYGQKKREIFEHSDQKSMNDEDAREMLDIYLEQKQAELDLEKIYLKRFDEVLDARQVWKVITFDSDFRRSLMRKISDEDGREPRQKGNGN